MIYVETNSIIGSENLAFEEYFLKKEDIREPVLMLWRNRPTIVVGAFQNTQGKNHLGVSGRFSGQHRKFC